MRIAATALAAQLLLWSAAPVLAQTALPEGASLASGVTALRTYAPTRNPGTTDFNPTDRAAITNLLAAYAFAYDNFEAAAWLSLFTADAQFVAGVPGGPTVSFAGDGFRSFWTKRMNAFRSSGEQRRHPRRNRRYGSCQRCGPSDQHGRRAQVQHRVEPQLRGLAGEGT